LQSHRARWLERGCEQGISDGKNASLLFPSAEFVASETEVAFWSAPALPGKVASCVLGPIAPQRFGRERERAVADDSDLDGAEHEAVEARLGLLAHLGRTGESGRGGDKLVLIDAGCGVNKFQNTTGRLLGHLASAGYAPGDIDMILFTHCHFDHLWGSPFLRVT
jgi:hypothetical protein